MKAPVTVWRMRSCAARLQARVIISGDMGSGCLAPAWTSQVISLAFREA